MDVRLIGIIIEYLGMLESRIFISLSLLITKLIACP